MTCPMAQRSAQSGVAADCISNAIEKCPFLNSLSQREGVEFARRVAICPTAPAKPRVKLPVLEEHYHEFAISVQQVHGPHGAVPLARFSQPVMELRSSELDRRAVRPVGAVASISLGGFGGLPDPSELLRKLGKQRKPRPGDNKGRVKPPRSSNSSSNHMRAQSAQPPPQGRCPMRKFIEPLGGLLPLIQHQLRTMQCPAAIVAARAAVAKTAAARQLRPQPLIYKMAAVGALSAVLNMPFGVWREHTDKFSPAWFAAVHTPIPFIAIFRKAIVMPKWAMLLTFTAAVVGQAYGARWERARLERGGPVLPWAPTNDVLKLACPMTYSQQAERFVDGVVCKDSTKAHSCAVNNNTIEVH